MTPDILVIVLTTFLIAVAFTVAFLRDTLAATIVFAAYSLGMAILWTALQAPDVALTEAAVGAGVTSSLFLVAIIKTGRPVGPTTFVRGIRPTSVLAVLALIAVLGATVPSLPAVGVSETPAFRHVAPTYLADAVPLLGTQNVVTAILAGFRAFDTFGEVTVVFAAGVAVLVIVGREVI